MAKQKSTSLRDLDFSMRGEQQAQKAENHFLETHTAISVAPKTQSTYRVFKLVRRKRGRVNIDGICDNVLNPNTGKRERIWLLNGAHSIWGTELTELLKDKSYINNNRRSLEFEDGILRIPEWDERAIEFATLHNNLIDNPSRRTGGKREYFEYNPQRIAEAALAKEMLELDMATEAKIMPIEKAKKLAVFFNIALVDELGFPKTDDGVRKELMVFAKRNPELFKRNLDSKEVEIAYLIRKCIGNSTIDLGGSDGNLRWAATQRPICKVPLSRKPYEYLLELALTNSDEGKSFLMDLERIGSQP